MAKSKAFSVLTCGSCGHFYTFHTTRGCKAPSCDCKLKVKESEK